MSDQLERKLAELAEVVDWPQSDPQLPRRVSGRIAVAPVPTPGRRLAVAAAVAVVVIGLVAALPTTRRAIADLLGVAGVRIDFGSEPPSEEEAGLGLGTRVGLLEAADLVGFALRVPAGMPPDTVYLGNGGEVSMVWAGGPPAGESDIAWLLSQRASTDSEYATKTLGPETVARTVTVEGTNGVWIEGAPHTITLLDGEGDRETVTTRLAGNVLLWTAHGVDHRLETTEGLSEALRVAETLEPVRPG